MKLISNRPLKNTKPSWTLSEDQMVYTRVFTNNDIYTTEVEDIYGNTVLLNLTEGEILMMNSAIVEAYIMPTSNLYITKYTQAGDQTAATPTYVPTTEVQNLIAVNANITAEARQNFTNRFIPGMRDYYINPQVNQYSEEAKYNIETGIQEQIEAARSAREEYLSGLEGY